MSIEAMKWAMDEAQERNLPMALRYLLLMMANAADHRGGNLYPSHGHLARRTGMAPSTVRAHIGALERLGLLSKTPRTRGHDGSQTSNMYQLAMAQAGLDLDETPLPEFSRGGGASRSAPPLPAATSTRELGEGKGRSKPAGQGKPSPVASLWTTYLEGMQALYKASPAPSAAANGKLAMLVKKLGAEAAPRVLEFYLRHPEPFYRLRRHPLELVVRDADKLWIELQQTTGEGANRAPPTKAVVHLEYADGKRRMLDDYPVGDHLQIAREAARAYAMMIGKTGPTRIAVQVGAERRAFSMDEVRA